MEVAKKQVLMTGQHPNIQFFEYQKESICTIYSI